MRRLAALVVVLVVTLAALGLVMLASTSSVVSQHRYSTPYFYLERQLIWMALAFFACFLAARLDYRWLRAWAPYILGASIVLLGLTLIPGIGEIINGSRRWISLGPVNIQSSELAKLALILYLSATLYVVPHEPAWGFQRVLWHVFAPIGAVLMLIFVEPDFGTTMLLALVAGIMAFVAGIRLRYLLTAGVLGSVGFVLAVLHDEVRMKRIMAFLNPIEHAEREAFQLLNALYAFVAGGVPGAGLGASLQKRFFLPECHTDFILPIIGEELGLAASMGVWFLFLCFTACGMTIAWHARDNFGRLLAMGVTLVLSLQAAINIAVVTGCIPTKGLALPFISYGGSSLVVSGVLVGLLISVSRVAAAGESATPRAQDRIRTI